jgi:hypothetical protein
MSDNPLINQADSLMQRLGNDPLGKPVSAPPADGDIPVLDEILTPAAARTAIATIDEKTKQLIIKAALEQLIPIVEERVTRDLQQRLVNHLHSAANAAVTVAMADLKLELSNAVGDAVNRAVHQVLKGSA